MSWTQLLFSVNGRIDRSVFWLKFVVPALAIQIVLATVDNIIGTVSDDAGIGLLSGLFSLALIWPGIAVSVKRLHDRNRSGWFYLLILIPIAGPIWYLIDVGCLGGTAGANRFGPDPLGRESESEAAPA